VFGAVEAALAQATKKLHGGEWTSAWRSTATPASTRPSAAGWWCPTSAGLQNPDAEEMLSDALDRIADIEEGDYIEEPIDSVPIGRIGARPPSR
jgi:N utilization substance protein A